MNFWLIPFLLASGSDETRRAALARSLPWPVLESEPKGFALLFQATRSLDTPTIWQRWIDDAYEWIHQHHLEDETVPHQQSKILRSYLHHMPYLTADHVRDCSPPFLKDSIVPSPAACRWGPTNPCSSRLLEFAHTEFPEAGYFFFTSHNSIPLKPFSYMYTEFIKDKRARVRIVYPKFGPDPSNLPKTSLWKGIPRSWADILTRNTSWAYQGWLSSPIYPGTIAAPDEWSMLAPVYQDLGEKMFDQINDASNYISSVNYDRVPWVYDCWFPELCPNSQWLSGYPAQIGRFDSFFVDSLIESPIMWFFRKATDNSSVGSDNSVGTDGDIEGPSSVPLADYLDTKILSNGSDKKFQFKACDNSDLNDIGRQKTWDELVDAVKAAMPVGVVSDLETLKGMMGDDLKLSQ